jgi:UDPglucose--hexose-1-phosphate uridylyltransferase
MNMPDLKEHPHRRFNPLTREWILVSPHRTQRPWQGQVEKSQPPVAAAYDPDCYLCPGNARAGNARNPAYTGTFVFDNDFAALLPDSPQFELDESGLIVASGERGVCRVVCFSPRHDLTIAKMDTGSVRGVVEVWAEQYVSLGEIPFVNYVQIFENRGAIMGASNPHPHGQIWASCSMPNEPAKEQSSQGEHLRRGTCLLCDYLALEHNHGERLICDNESFSALVPFWAIWPFEAMLISKRHVTGMDELRGDERSDLADIMKRLTTRYDNLFETSFPYSMGFHQRPSDGAAHPEWHLHAHYYPPLLRSAGVRKFMVGYEMLAMPQRDITPETAAARLREMPE